MDTTQRGSMEGPGIQDEVPAPHYWCEMVGIHNDRVHLPVHHPREHLALSSLSLWTWQLPIG